MTEDRILHLPSSSRLDGRALIRIFPSLVEPAVHPDVEADASVFVSIGAGETHVTVLDCEGSCTRGWTAVFGWSALCSLPFACDAREMTFDEEVLVARALTGSTRVYGRKSDTSAFVGLSAMLFRTALEEILSRTIGSGAAYDAIIFAAPAWLHPALGASMDLRPHILPDVREI
jgi:hypothetical protein